MNENLKKFLQTAATDEEILAKLQKAASPEEAYKIATDFSGGYTYEEFVEGMKNVNDSLTKASDGELSDDDLLMVAGGKGTDRIIDTIIQTASVISASASAAATAAS